MGSHRVGRLAIIIVNFLIADTFTDSLARLNRDEQKAAKTTAFDLQLNPASPGLSFHKLDRAKDKNFWSVRVGSDIRLIVHKNESSLLLCYVDHHDKAYDWAERRKLETHPKTGAAQLVEIRETVKEVLVPVYVQTELVLAPMPTPARKPLFASMADDVLLSYGIPADWLGDVKLATDETLLTLADHLPAEAAEALLELATGGKPRVSAPAALATNPFDHPDAQRRFRVMTNVDELQQALDFPWEKWTVFLHPEQRQLVDRDYDGPARVAGSAGTGKTIVALHRAAHLARKHEDSRVLLATFSDTLANALRTKLKRLVGNEPRLGERIDVYSLNAIGLRLYKSHVGPVAIASREVLRKLIIESAGSISSHKFTSQFLLSEWDHVIDAWQLDSWDTYREVVRLGRKTRLPEPQRAVLWEIFERVRFGLKQQGLITEADMFSKVAATLAVSGRPIFEFAVIDEAQDLSIAQIKFLAAVGGNRPNALFFAGDLGQRIFQQPFSWKSLGIDIRGRSRTLRINYRTSHQIRAQADRLLGPTVVDVDGNSQDRSDTISVFNGTLPTICTYSDMASEIVGVSEWIAAHAKTGMLPHEFGIFVRSPAELPRAEAAVKKIGLAYKTLDEHVDTMSGHVSISTMHLAKGLEFRAVVVMACDDEVIPLQTRIETVGDDGDLQEVYDTERHLLYVACTRARDHLLVTGVEPASEFLDDLRTQVNLAK